MPSAEVQLATFRDPAGSLRVEGDRVLRCVRPELACPALCFLESDLAHAWVAQGRLVETHFIPGSDGELTLEHPRIFFPCYPWEWTPSAWVAAAALTLDLCDALLDQGLILKDATPLNVLFQGSQPVFVDVLSIDARDPHSPLWLAYAQFVRTFLLPLAAYQYLGWPLAASIHKRDGYEPADLAPYLTRWQKWREPLRSLVSMPLMLERNGAQAAQNAAKVRQEPEVALTVLRRNLAMLRKSLKLLSPAAGQGSRWSRYTETADHYAAEDQSRKQRFVREVLATSQPRHVLDLGANTGVFSRIAAEASATVVAWDTDGEAAERNRTEAARHNLSILSIVANPARPTPAVGWRNAESLSLLDRARGRFDCVMMLGLIHHLLLFEQIPLEEIAALLRELTTRWAVAEWVPAKDPRFQDLLRGRDDLYGHLDEAAFLNAMENYFTVVRREVLPNGRVLFLLQAS
jgi:SAM-dependent methyltransferase